MDVLILIGRILFALLFPYRGLRAAELSRAAAPDPDLWQEAADRADFVHFRMGVRVRRAEAVLRDDRGDDARQEAVAVRTEAPLVGGRGLVRLIDAVAAELERAPG